MNRFFRGIFIVWTVWRFGLHELILSNFSQPLLKLLSQILTLGRTYKASRGERLRLALEQLGPIFVKFGQVMSTRRDLLPDDIAVELAKLQDRVPPFSSDIAVANIERAFGRSVEEIFESFDHVPVASASIAQVHFALLKNKEGVVQEVAVKVLRPNMLPAIEKDLNLMRMMAGWLEKLSADGKRLKPREVVAEFDKHLHDELDLVREAANAAQLRRNMQSLNLVLIPEMYWDFCHPEVIVMERMKGLPISQIDALRTAGVDIPQLAKDGVTLFFTQVFRDGFFHADMHPGNIQVSIEPETLGRYISLDYKRVAELHIESGWVPANTRVDELESAIRTVCEPYFDRPLKEISLGMVLMRLFQTSRRFNVEIQPQLVLLQKTLLNIEGLGRQLDPELDLWNTAKPFLEQWMIDQVGPKRFFQQLREQAPQYAKILPQLPRLMHDYLKQTTASAHDRNQLAALLAEQQRTNRLLQAVVYVVIGFVSTLIVLNAFERFHQI